MTIVEVTAFPLRIRHSDVYLGAMPDGSEFPRSDRYTVREPWRSLDSITEPDAFADELAVVRKRRYATEVEELAWGRACIAAPIRDQSGQIVAAISLSGPLSAIDLAHREGELVTKIIEAADRVSSGLGHLDVASIPAAERGASLG